MVLHARTLIAGAILACMLAASFCSKKSTGPSGDGPSEATAVIGTEGGTLAVDDFSLTVPAGAFDGNHTLRLYTRPDDETFGESRATRVFRIDGFPETFTRPLRLALKTERTLTGETFIAQGDSLIDPLSGKGVTVYDVHHASDSSGFLACNLDPVGGPAPAFHLGLFRKYDNLRERTLHVFGIDGMRTKATPRFKVTGIEGYTTGHDEEFLNNLLEENYSIMLEELGMDFTDKWPDLPVQALLHPFPPGIPMVCSGIRMNRWFMNIDMNAYLADRNSAIRLGSGLNMVLFALLKPGLADALLNGTMDPVDQWLHLAVTHWSEELFSDDPDYRRHSMFPGSEMAPFWGMARGVGHSTAKHHCGMAAVIKFLFRQDYFTPADLLNAYQDINGYGTAAPQDPTKALLSNVQELITVWWPDFFKTYITGGVYGVAPSVFLDQDHVSGAWTIDPDGASERIFSSADSRVGAYPDLSAKLFLVDAGDADMPENASLIIDVEGEVTDQGLSTLVFAVHPDRLEYLGGGPATAANPEIRNLKSNAESGIEQYLICVVNSTSHDGYLGSSAIDLTLKLLNTEESPEFDLCQVTLQMEGEFEYVRASNGETSTSTRRTHVSSTDTLSVALTDSGYSGSVTWVLNGTTYTQTVQAALNADGSRVTELEYADFRSKPGEYEIEYRMVLRDIPIWSQSDSHAMYFVEGEETCSSVSHYSEIRRGWDSISGTFTGTSTCKRYWCASSSEIIFTLKKRGS